MVVLSGKVIWTLPPGSPVPVKVGRLLAVVPSPLVPVSESGSSLAVQSLVPVGSSGLFGSLGSTGSSSILVSFVAAWVSASEVKERPSTVVTTVALAVSSPSGRVVTLAVVDQEPSALTVAVTVTGSPDAPRMTMVTMSFSLAPMVEPLRVTLPCSLRLMRLGSERRLPSKICRSTLGPSMVTGSLPVCVLPAASVILMGKPWPSGPCVPLGRAGTPAG